MSRVRFFVKRTIITAALIVVVASALFLFFRMMPGDYGSVMMQAGASQEAVEKTRAKWGLDDPMYVQYFHYVVNMLTANPGDSFIYGIPVWTLVKERMINSFILVGPAITAAYVVGGLIGVVLGSNRGTLMEKSGLIGVTFFKTLPEFFTGIVLLVIFSLTLGIFPTSGMLSLDTSQRIGNDLFARFVTIDFWMHYALPFTTIMLYYMTIPALIMRNAVVENLGQDFLYYHRVKGLPGLSIKRKLIKHSSIPVITLYPVSMTRAIGGMVLVEVVFNWPGIGKLLVDSVLARDFPTVQFVFLIAAIWVILGNYVIDVLYSIIDPRVAIEGDGA